MNAQTVTPEIDLEMAGQFLQEIGTKHVFALLPEGGIKGKKPPLHRYGALQENAFSLSTANTNGYGVFYTVNECDGERNGGNITRVRSVFTDLDGASLEPISYGPLEPHFVMETSPGRFHVYWLVDDVPLDLFTSIQKRLAERFGGDPAVCDLARLMRVPGFYHNKGEPFPTQVITHNHLPRYALADLEKAFGSFSVSPANSGLKNNLVELDRFRQKQRENGVQPAFEKVIDRCAFIKHCVSDASGLSEKEWWSAISIVVHCDNGDALAHQISEPYPTYSKHETGVKIRQALREGKPHSCKYIENDINGDYCGDCPNRGSVKSPISLGYDRSQRLDNEKTEASPEVAELNQKHAFVMIGGKASILNEEQALDGRTELTFSAIPDFRNRYSNRSVFVPRGGKLREVKLGDFWLDSPSRRQYDRLVFAPGRETPSNIYNLYKGLSVKPVQGDWSLMKRHILEVIADDNTEVFHYLLAYLARLFQDPGGERPGVAPVLIGDQGTGKGELVRNLGQMFGVHFLHIATQGQLTGRFNSHLMQTILLYVDEGFFAGDKSAEGTIKAVITEPTIAIEAKGKDIFSVDNHVNLIFSSNNSWVVPAGLEERRFLVLKVSNRYRQNHQYFKALREQMDNGGREAMLYDLLAMDIAGINLRQVPRTRALLEQIVHSLDSSAKFWFEALMEGELPMGRGLRQALPTLMEPDHWEGWHATEFVYQAYTSFCQDLGLRRPVTKSLFIREIKKLCPSIQHQRATRDDGEGRPMGYVFPELDLCRKEFEQVVKIEVPWT